MSTRQFQGPVPRLIENMKFAGLLPGIRLPTSIILYINTMKWKWLLCHSCQNVMLHKCWTHLMGRILPEIYIMLRIISFKILGVLWYQAAMKHSSKETCITLFKEFSTFQHQTTTLHFIQLLLPCISSWASKVFLGCWEDSRDAEEDGEGLICTRWQ